MKDHIDVVHEGVIIRCPVEGCNSSFKNRSNIRHHLKQMHSKETFKCQDCDYVGKTQRAVKVHFGVQHGIKYFACEFCDYTAGYQHRIDTHTRTKHSKVLTEEQQKRLNIKTCQNCGMKSEAGRVNHHIKFGCKGKEGKREKLTSRYKDAGFQCSVCKDLNFDVFFKDKCKLKYHINDKHSKNALNCNECTFQSGYESKLLEHKRRRHRKMSCNSCIFSGLLNAFTIHLKRIHGVPKQKKMSKNNLKCSSCNETPWTKNSYQIHTYWKHGATDAVPIFPRYKDKMRRDSRAHFKVEDSIITEKVSKTVEKVKVIEPQEYHEESISPIKSEEDTVVNDCDDISGDEEDFLNDQNHTEMPIKTEQFQYLCPISYCTFTTNTDIVSTVPRQLAALCQHFVKKL